MFCLSFFFDDFYCQNDLFAKKNEVYNTFFYCRATTCPAGTNVYFASSA